MTVWVVVCCCRVWLLLCFGDEAEVLSSCCLQNCGDVGEARAPGNFILSVLFLDPNPFPDTFG